MTVWVPRTIRSAGRLLRSRDARRNALHEWQRQLAGVPVIPAAGVRSVLVLCHGNICRSPFAQAWLVRRRPDLAVASAGLAAGEGAPADPAASRVALGFGVDLSGHRSRPVDRAALARADLVLVMEAAHAAAVRERAPEAAARTFVLGDFLDTRPFGIADPWGQLDPIFASTFERIADAAERLALLLGDAPR
jgi:protein-tyrosine phosphatase